MNDSPLEMVKASADINIDVVGKEIAGDIPTPEALCARLEAIGNDLRNLIVDAKRLKRIQGLEAHQDQGRALAQGQSFLQTGFMWIRRAIRPQSDF